MIEFHLGFPQELNYYHSLVYELVQQLLACNVYIRTYS